jgi:hypothetical protein
MPSIESIVSSVVVEVMQDAASLRMGLSCVWRLGVYNGGCGMVQLCRRMAK